MSSTSEPAFDVVVVGSGGGALTGAHLAQKRGLRSWCSRRPTCSAAPRRTPAAPAGCPAAEVQQRAGIADSTESARELPRRRAARAPTRTRSRPSWRTRPRWSPSSRRTTDSTSSGCRSRSTTTRPGRVPLGPLDPADEHQARPTCPRGRRPGAAAGRARPGRRGRPAHAEPAARRSIARLLDDVHPRRRHRAAPALR